MVACQTCKTCQLTKRKSIKYGKLLPKVAEADPWDILCVDMIGPYKIQHTTKKTKATKYKKSEPLNLDLWAVTMIDPATGWFEIKQVEDIYAHTTAEVMEQTWLCRYP